MFCLSRTVSGDCTRILFGLINRLVQAGMAVEAVSQGRAPSWTTCLAPWRTILTWEEALADTAYAAVIVSNAHLIPMVLPWVGKAPVALFCQGYESYYYGSTFHQLRSECEPLRQLKQLPVTLLAASRSVQRLLLEQVGRTSHYVPVAIDRDLLAAANPAPPGAEFRVLMSGAPRAPYKGMADGFAALQELAQEFPVRLVLLSPETRPSQAWVAYGLQAEVHYLPEPGQAAASLAGCHAYCCSSWYEGHDLTTLEAFAAGVAVVSTRNLGVDDYGQDEHNLLLVDPNQPRQLARALRRLHSESGLAGRLSRQARATMAGAYLWESTVSAFLAALHEAQQAPSPAPVDARQMHERVAQLEREGYHTPLEVHRLIAGCSAELAGPERPDIPRLKQLRRRLRACLENPRAQYYAAARSTYDRAGLLLAALPPCF